MADHELTHPLYLDVQMMYSFLGFLDGGYSLKDEQTSKTATSRDSEGHGSVSAKTSKLLPFGAEAAIDGSTGRKTENSSEYREERHRNEASLFNRLYGRLHYENKIHRVDAISDAKGALTGHLVELHGRYDGNPIAEILELAEQFYTYSLISGQSEASEPPDSNAASTSSANAGSAPTSSKPDEQFAARMILQMNQDMLNSPVRDLLMTTFGSAKAVLTVSSEYFPSTTREFLRESEIKVLGKITRSLQSAESINLMRRTIIGVAGEEVASKLVGEFSKLPAIRFNSVNPIVAGPALQILPMAIFV